MRRHALWLQFPVVALILCGACGVLRAQDAAVDVHENVVYRTVDGVDLAMDIAVPKGGEGPYPALVFIHGGGWRGGNRAGYRKEIERAASQGFVAATITYRLTQPDEGGKAKYPFPAQVHDCKAAVRWLRQNAKKYQIDGTRMGAIGGSAGGHLSLMVGLADESAGLEEPGADLEISSRVQAVVNYFGPTDMLEMNRTSRGAAPIVASFLGGRPDAVPEAYKSASPATYVSKDDPPVLSLHGTDDQLVPPEQAKILDEKMKQAGASHTLKLLEGQGHGFRDAAAEEARKATYEFFTKHLKNSAGK